jgi:hypothetical protein
VGVFDPGTGSASRGHGREGSWMAGNFGIAGKSESRIDRMSGGDGRKNCGILHWLAATTYLTD